MKFKDIVCSACLHNPKLEVELADEFEVPQSMVRRWANGVAKPPPTSQKLVTASIYRRQLKAARLTLREKLKDEPWLRGIGIGEVAGVGVIRVSVASASDVCKVPTLFERIPVVTVVMGEIVAQ